MKRIIKKGELLSYAFADLGTEDSNNRFVAREDIVVSTKKPKKDEEEITILVKTFPNGEVWASTTRGERKTGAVGRDAWSAIRNMAQFAIKMDKSRKNEEKNMKRIRCKSTLSNTAAHKGANIKIGKHRRAATKRGRRS